MYRSFGIFHKDSAQSAQLNLKYYVLLVVIFKTIGIKMS